MSRRFARGLPDPFVKALTEGACRPFLDACHARGFDVRLRDDYLNAYELGRSVANLAWSRRGPRLIIHRWYLRGTPLLELAPDGGTRGDYPWWRLRPEVLDAWLASLDAMVVAAGERSGPEERWERALIAANTGVLSFVDRQVQVPGIQRKADLVGVVQLPDGPAFLVGEVKAGANSDLQKGPSQTARYLDILAEGGGLDPVVAASYAKVARQLDQLGFQTPASELFTAGMPAVGLLILCDYPHHRPELARRAREQGAELGRRIGLVFQEPGRAVVAPPGDWEWLSRRGS